MPDLSLDLLQQEIDYVLTNNDWGGAFESYNIAKDWLNESEFIKKSPVKYRQYNSDIMKLKFLSLDYFDNVEDYVDLLKNYFPLIFEMVNFDLWSKIETQLIAMIDLDARDAFKTQLREALNKSDSLLINQQKYNNEELPSKVSDWIKDFIVNLGLDSFDKVKKMEYLSNGKYIRLLDQADRLKVKVLLDVYEKLMLSSLTKEGYENSVAMNIDGRSIIFNRGVVEDVQGLDLIKKIPDSAADSSKVDDILNSDSLNSSAFTPLVAPTVSAADPLSHTAELEAMLNNYSPDSLEYKAVSQEILRLKKVAARKNVNK